MTTITKPRILVARKVFPEVLVRLAAHFAVQDNQADALWAAPQLIQQLQGCAGALVTGTESIDAALLQACPDLRAVCSMAVGYDNIDVEACTRHGVLASNAPGVLTETTADFAFALMMAAARRIGEAEHFLRAGRWTRWGVDLFAGADIHGSTLGVLGMGRIGQAIARRGALGFGMPVLYHNRTRLDAAVEASLRATHVSKERLLRDSDHLMLVLPYSAQAHHAIGAPELALMKSTATLTNVARGGIVDDAALAAALRERRIAAAGLDVFEGEPALHGELLRLSSVVLTPHIASASVRTRLAMANLAADNLIAALIDGEPPSALNPQVLRRGGR